MLKLLSNTVIKTKRKLLFFGDVAPKYLSGTSIAAKINLDILKDTFTILHLEEGDNWKQHTQSGISKIVRNINHAWSICRIVQKEKPHIFYSHLPSSLSGIIKIWVLLQIVIFFSKAKVVLHLHRGDYHLQYKQSNCFRLLTKIINKKIDELIVLSSNHKATLIKIFAVSKMSVLKNTIEQEYIIESSKQTDKIKFLYLSNYIEEKGILDLLVAFSELSSIYPQIELHTYGNIFDEEFMKRIKAFEDKKTIFIHGKIEGEQKFRCIAQSDCFILPSWNEGQPLVLLEAMSQSTPVIASAVGFVPELLGELYPYIFKSQNLDELKEIIIQFLETNQRNWGEYLLERYKNEFSHQSHQLQLKQIFDSI